MQQIKKIFLQTSWQLAGKLVHLISGLIILTVVSRNYGAEGIGIFTLTLTYLATFYLIADLGLNGYILPQLTLDKHIANKLFNFRLIWSVVLVLMANLIAYFLPFSNPQFQQAVLLGSPTIIGSAIFNSVNLVFQANLEYHRSSMAGSLKSLVQIPLLIYLTSLHLSVSFLTAILVLGDITASVASLTLVRKFYKFKLEFANLAFMTSTLKQAWPISLTLLVNTIYFRLDAFILTSIHSFVDTGNYNLAYSIFQNILVIPTFIMNAFYPLMIKSLGQSKLIFFKQIKLALIILAGLSMIAAVFAWAFADLIIGLIAGSEFRGSVVSLRILCLSLPAFFISALLLWVLISLKKYIIILVIYLTGLVINSVLNLIFIPGYSYFAASWATVVTEYIILIMLMITLLKASKEKIG